MAVLDGAPFDDEEFTPEKREAVAHALADPAPSVRLEHAATEPLD